MTERTIDPGGSILIGCGRTVDLCGATFTGSDVLVGLVEANGEIMLKIGPVDAEEDIRLTLELDITSCNMLTDGNVVAIGDKKLKVGMETAGKDLIGREEADDGVIIVDV